MSVRRPLTALCLLPQTVSTLSSAHGTILRAERPSGRAFRAFDDEAGNIVIGILS